MRPIRTAVLGAALLLFAVGAATGAWARSPAMDAVIKYRTATQANIDALDQATEDGDKYAGCRALDGMMRNARATANALVDLIEETKADRDLSDEERARRLGYFRDDWDTYDKMARDVSNSMDLCSGIDYR